MPRESSSVSGCGGEQATRLPVAKHEQPRQLPATPLVAGHPWMSRSQLAITQPSDHPESAQPTRFKLQKPSEARFLSASNLCWAALEAAAVQW
jgi:hypothetical protein